MEKKLHLLLLFLLIETGNIFAQTQLIQNGSFSNLYSNWTTSGNWYISSSYSCYNSASAYAYLGDASGQPVNNAWGNLQQTITIPSNATSATLSFYSSANTQEITTSSIYDYCEVYFFNTSGSNIYTFPGTNINNLTSGSYPGCQSYVFHTFSIPSSFFGQTLVLTFHGYTDAARPTMFRIDDVSLLATVPSCTGVTAVTSQPQSQTICSGNSATFTVACNGTGTLTYFWCTCTGTPIPITGAPNSPSYTTSTPGTYCCEIENYCPTLYQVTSNTATLTVVPSSPPAPTFITPTSYNCCVSTTATNDLEANGQDPSYQGGLWVWYSGSCGGTRVGSGMDYYASEAQTGTTTYYLRAENFCGTSSCASATITVNAAPPTPIPTVTPSTPCQGSSFTLNANVTGIYYEWHDPSNNIVSNNQNDTVSTGIPGQYCLIYEQNGCYSLSGCVNVTINSTPPTPTISQAGHTLTSSSTTGNQWYLNGSLIPGATSQTFNVTQNGNYTVIATINGCPSNISNTINIINVGIEEINITNNIIIQPNPNNGIFTIEFLSSVLNHKIQMEIFNEIGVKIYSSTIKNRISEIDLSKQSKGTYSVKIIDGEQIYIKKIITN